MQDVGISVQSPMGVCYVHNIRGDNPVEPAKSVNQLSTLFMCRHLIAAKAEYCLGAYNKAVTTKKRCQFQRLIPFIMSEDEDTLFIDTNTFKIVSARLLLQCYSGF